MPPIAPPYDPKHNEAFESFVYRYYDQHKQSDLVHPTTYHDIVELLNSGFSVRDKNQPFDKDFRAWVRRRDFVLSEGSLHKLVQDKQGTQKLLAVVTLPDVGKTIHGIHALLLKHGGQDATKQKVQIRLQYLSCSCAYSVTVLSFDLLCACCRSRRTSLEFLHQLSLSIFDIAMSVLCDRICQQEHHSHPLSAPLSGVGCRSTSSICADSTMMAMNGCLPSRTTCHALCCCTL